MAREGYGNMERVYSQADRNIGDWSVSVERREKRHTCGRLCGFITASTDNTVIQMNLTSSNIIGRAFFL